MQILSQLQGMSSPLLMFYFKGGGDVRDGSGLFWIYVLLELLADLKYGFRVIYLYLDAFLKCVGEVIQGVGQFLDVPEGVLRMKLS